MRFQGSLVTTSTKWAQDPVITGGYWITPPSRAYFTSVTQCNFRPFRKKRPPHKVHLQPALPIYPSTRYDVYQSEVMRTLASGKHGKSSILSEKWSSKASGSTSWRWLAINIHQWRSWTLLFVGCLVMFLLFFPVRVEIMFFQQENQSGNKGSRYMYGICRYLQISHSFF